MAELLLKFIHGESHADQRDAERKILEASREGLVETVKLLLQRKVDLEVTDREGRRPLHLAALGGHDRVARELLLRGADASAETPEGLCCVHYAALGGHIITLMLLLEFRCDVRALTKDGSTALHLAAAHGHSSAVEWLVTQAGLKVASANKKRETALDLARKAGHKATVQSLVQVQISDILSCGDVGTLSQLVEEFNLDVLCAKENDKGFRSVHYAAYGGHVKVLEILQNKKYDMKCVTNQGYSALHYAVKYSHLAAVKWLVKKAGLDATLGPSSGVVSALELARRERNEEIVTCLEKVSTVKALESDNLEALRNLVREGVDVEAVCERKFGIRVAHVAAKLGHLTLLKNLREIKCDVKAEADSGKTALHFAANYGQLEAVKWLVEEAGLDVSRRSRDGLTALGCAEKGNHVDIIVYLRQIPRVGGLGNNGNADQRRETVKAGAAGGGGGGGAVERKGAGAATGRGEATAINQDLAKTDKACVKEALSSGDFKGLIKLIEKGADVDTLIYENNDQGMRAVHYAAQSGNMEMLRALKQSKVDLKPVTRKGFTALHCAVLNGQLDAVRWLVAEAGLDAACRSKGGETALDLAKTLKMTEITNYLTKSAYFWQLHFELSPIFLYSLALVQSTRHKVQIMLGFTQALCPNRGESKIWSPIQSRSDQEHDNANAP
ncbi:putative ankyrin repeat protein RF_0381 [Penaeus indicus]|uniref:putative ankyrin repeat protein RF_0381 n=1 Tax=Penaeus indicus TaxID=29960 RepID=UPI00300CA5C7